MSGNPCCLMYMFIAFLTHWICSTFLQNSVNVSLWLI
jgi:hypothetical protein